MTTSWRRAQLTLLIAVALPAFASGQTAPGPRLGLAQPAVSTPLRMERPSIADSVRPSHWVAGMVIGAVVGAGVGTVLGQIGRGVGDTEQSTTGTVLVSMLVFSLIGGLIGSGMHGHP